ncbi:MAG: GFA family protein [Paracoccaceae bacterium]
MQVDGSCLCGQITYTAVVDPEKSFLCHCSDCQTNAGTSYGHVVGVVDDQFHLKTGELKTYIKTADSGRERTLAFCGTCATRIYARTPDDPTAFFGLRAGTVHQRDQLPPVLQVWTESAQPWVFDLRTIPVKGD